VIMKAINLFVVQPSTIASTATGSVQTRSVLESVMCVTAMWTVPTVPTKETAVSWWGL